MKYPTQAATGQILAKYLSDDTLLELGAEYRRGHRHDCAPIQRTLGQLRDSFIPGCVTTHGTHVITSTLPDAAGFVECCRFWYFVEN